MINFLKKTIFRRNTTKSATSEISESQTLVLLGWIGVVCHQAWLTGQAATIALGALEYLTQERLDDDDLPLEHEMGAHPVSKVLN